MAYRDLREGVRSRSIFVLGPLFFITFITAVGSSQSASERPSLSPGPAWQEEWVKIRSRGKAERKLVIYSTAPADMRSEINKAFRDYGVGIDLEWVSGRSSELEVKMNTEIRAGIFNGDLYMGGSNTHISLKNKGLSSPIKPLLLLPEVLDNLVYYEGKIPFIDTRETHALIAGQLVSAPIFINTNLIKAGEIKGWADLLNPKWKGKIVMDDPTTPGTASAVFHMTTTKIMGPDFYRQLVKQEPVLTRDRRQSIEWLARGKYPIAIAPDASLALKFREEGVPINLILPKEGTFVATNSTAFSYFHRAPHPNAAQVFINWVMTKEGSTIYNRATQTQSVRNDVPADYLPSVRVRDPQKKYFNYAREEEMLKTPESFRLAREIYGPLLK